MTLKTTALALALTASALLGTHAPQARAGDVSGARISCYVDTYAYDEESLDYCASIWTPGSATNPTQAIFTVVGLPAGSYSYRWVDLETNRVVCENSATCVRPIATETRGDGQVMLRVIVTDLQTGASRSADAVAEYYDGWT